MLLERQGYLGRLIKSRQRMILHDWLFISASNLPVKPDSRRRFLVGQF
jgi:hypothetical protein